MLNTQVVSTKYGQDSRAQVKGPTALHHQEQTTQETAALAWTPGDSLVAAQHRASGQAKLLCPAASGQSGAIWSALLQLLLTCQPAALHVKVNYDCFASPMPI